jgi:hypothetical protein
VLDRLWLATYAEWVIFDHDDISVFLEFLGVFGQEGSDMKFD